MCQHLFFWTGEYLDIGGNTVLTAEGTLVPAYRNEPKLERSGNSRDNLIISSTEIATIKLAKTAADPELTFLLSPEEGEETCDVERAKIGVVTPNIATARNMKVPTARRIG